MSLTCRSEVQALTARAIGSDHPFVPPGVNISEARAAFITLEILADFFQFLGSLELLVSAGVRQENYHNPGTVFALFVSYLTLFSLSLAALELTREMLELAQLRGRCVAWQLRFARLTALAFFATSVTIYSIILFDSSTESRRESFLDLFVVAAASLLFGQIALFALLFAMDRCLISCCFFGQHPPDIRPVDKAKRKPISNTANATVRTKLRFPVLREPLPRGSGGDFIVRRFPASWPWLVAQGVLDRWVWCGRLPVNRSPHCVPGVDARLSHRSRLVRTAGKWASVNVST